MKSSDVALPAVPRLDIVESIFLKSKITACCSSAGCMQLSFVVHFLGRCYHTYFVLDKPGHLSKITHRWAEKK